MRISCLIIKRILIGGGRKSRAGEQKEAIVFQTLSIKENTSQALPAMITLQLILLPFTHWKKREFLPFPPSIT